MKPEEMEKLLGGYATGTLSEAEQRALFEAALHDQKLFDALAREQSLRDLLRDPDARAELLGALDPAPAPRRWWGWRPAAAVLAMAGVAGVAVLLARRPHPAAVPQARMAVVPEVAEVRPPAAPMAPAPEPAPHRVAARRRERLKAGAAGSVVAALTPPAVVSNPDAKGPAPLAAPAPAPPPPAPAAVSAEVSGTVVQTQAQAIERVPTVQPRVRTMFAPQAGLQPESLAIPPRTPLPAVSARALFLGANPRPLFAQAAMARASPAAVLAIRYSWLRRDAEGNLVEIAPGEPAAAGTLALRLTANTSGYLSVAGAAPVPVATMVPYTTPTLPAGPSEVRVAFTTRAQPEAEELAGGEIPITEVAGRETYVANQLPGGVLRFTVRLPF
jgi:hypothetical protein